MPKKGKATFLALMVAGAIAATIAAQSYPVSSEQTLQLVANPFFEAWSDSGPDLWRTVGSATVERGFESYDALWAGPNASAIVNGWKEGNGIAQRNIRVKPNTRYDFYAWAKVPAANDSRNYRYVVKGENSGKVYLSDFVQSVEDRSRWENIVGTGWENLVGTFFTGANETALSIEFHYVGEPQNLALTLHLDNITLWERAVDSSPSLVPKPEKAVVLYGFGEHFGQLDDTGTIAATNVYDNIFPTPTFVNELRKQKKVVAHRVYPPGVRVNEPRDVDELVAYWLQPYRNTLQGRIGQGFDAIAIDEFLGWDDRSFTAEWVAVALGEVRQLYPGRQIYIWGSWELANGGPACWLCQAGQPTYDKVLAAVNRYADALIVEAYSSEGNPELAKFRLMAQNLAQREGANLQVRGILAKTLFGLAIYQSPHGLNADNTPTIDFKAFLDEQFHRIKHIEPFYSPPGVALFAYFSAPQDTMKWVNSLLDHYIWRGRSTYLGPGRLNVGGYDGNGRLGSLLGEANPSFEIVGANWTLSGNVQYLRYSDIGDIPNWHGASYTPAYHGEYLLKMERSAQATSGASQKVLVNPATTYALNAYVIAGKAGSSARIAVKGVKGSESLDKSLRLPNLSTSEWVKIGFLFTTPADGGEIIIILSDDGAFDGNVIFWDYVEVGQKESFDIFWPTIRATANSLWVSWVTDLPAQAYVQSGPGGGQVGPSLVSSTPTTNHGVVLYGLEGGQQHRVRLANAVSTEGRSDPEDSVVSFTYAPFTVKTE